MQVAAIPPMSLLPLTSNLNYHMMLPKHFIEDEKYRAFYLTQNGFKILDNGEAEGDRFSHKELFVIADALAADEIVVPDVLSDAQGTIKQAKKFRSAADDHPTYSYMAVVQGTNYQEYSACLEGFLELDYINTIGVPRRMVSNLGVDSARVGFCEMMADLFPTIPVHCLGANQYIREVKILAKYHNVRGIDTSLPFVLGLENVDINDANYIDRQPDFFQRSVDSIQIDRSELNLLTYRAWAEDYTETPFSRV